MARRKDRHQHLLSAPVEPAVAAQVRHIAKANGTTVSAVIRLALAAWLRGNC